MLEKRDPDRRSTFRKCYQPLADVLIIHERDEILVQNVWYISMEHGSKHKTGLKTSTPVTAYKKVSNCICKNNVVRASCTRSHWDIVIYL